MPESAQMERAVAEAAAETAEAAGGYAEVAEAMRGRAAMYGMFAHLYRKEVDKDILGQMQQMRFPTATGNKYVDEGYRDLYRYLRTAWDDSLRELAVDYVRTFIGHGVNGYSAAYPYESVYTSERRLMMQEARAEVLKVFRENHLKRDRWTEGEDHVSIEFEFMQRMALRTAEALERGDEDEAVAELRTQLSFIDEHLLNWIPMFVTDIMQFSQTSFYKGLGKLTLGYLETDRDLVQELLED